MNLLLFESAERDGDQLRLGADRRLAHLLRVLRAVPGDTVRVGEIGANRGTATIEEIDDGGAVLRLDELGVPPAAGLDVIVVLALPRPKMLRRILRACAEFGIRELHLVNAARVEKSFWQSPLLAPENLRAYLLAGLEQAGDTRLPPVFLQNRFRPFAEDVLPGLCQQRAALIGQPDAAEAFPATPAMPALLAIGPEGGFVPFEVDCLRAAGGTPVSLGARVLRVETALQACLGRYL